MTDKEGTFEKTNTKLVLIFLLATFGLSWGIHLLTTRVTGQDGIMDSGLPPTGMLIPAFVALGLQVFVAKESKIYFRKELGKPRWIIYTYLIITLLIFLLMVLAIFSDQWVGVLRIVGNIAPILWTLMLIRYYRRFGEERFKSMSLQLGDANRGVWFVIGIVLFFTLQTALNWVFGFGEFQGIQECIYGVPIPRALYPLALLVFLLLSIIGTPLSSLAFTFGEEYAWRGFLQTELTKLSQRRGVLLVGLVWGLWHIPIILSGIHTYQPTLTGFTLAFIFFILWGYVQSYAVIKTGSIWVAAFLHGVVNSVYAFTLTYLLRPEDKIFSFGLGIYGLVCLVIVVLFILRDPRWRGEQKFVFGT